MDWPGELKTYGGRVLRHWFAVGPAGGVVAVIGLGDLFGWYELHVPFGMAAVIGVGALLPAQFLAWRDATHAAAVSANAARAGDTVALERLERIHAEDQAKSARDEAHRAALTTLARLLIDHGNITTEHFSTSALFMNDPAARAKGMGKLHRWADQVLDASRQLRCPYPYGDRLHALHSVSDGLVMYNISVEIAQQIRALLQAEGVR